MSMGLDGAFGVNEFQKALRQRILDNLAQEQQKFQNTMTVRGADRADRALNQQDELTRLKIEELRQNAMNAETDKQFTIGKSLNETLPADTVIPTSSAAVGPLRMIGALRTEQPTLPSTSTVGVMQAPTGSGVIAGRLVSQTKNEGNPLQFRKLPSAGQQNVIADNARADATAAREAANQPLEQVIGPDGKPTLKPRSQAAGMAPYHVPPPPQLAIVQTTDDHGQNVTKIVPKVAGSEFAGKQDAATVASERASKEALGTFDQLDRAIDAAKDLIGPGEGRVSSVEQMIGNPDPRINELGVMIKATKMRADHAITGSVRAAASPTLIKQWDDLLANKLTPESLHGTVRALRAVVQGPGGGKGKPTAEELIRKYGGDQ